MTFSNPLLRAAIFAIALWSGGVAAHEGQDHGEQATKPVNSGAVPRLAAASGAFELVALLRNGELVIYLDRFETNVPIVGASITVETAVGPVAASAGDGAYRLPAPWATSGPHDLIFTVTVEDLTEVLTGTLSVAPERPAGFEEWQLDFLLPALLRGSGTASLPAARSWPHLSPLSPAFSRQGCCA